MGRPASSSSSGTRGLVSIPARSADVVSTTQAPPEELADVVSALWTGRWDLTGRPPHETLLLGDPSVHVVFEGGDRRDARLVGVWTKLWRRALEGRGFVRGAKLLPGAARAFFDGTVATWTNRIVPLRSLAGPSVGAVARAVIDADDASGLRSLAAWLSARRRRDEAHNADVRLAVAIVERIRTDRDLVTVDRLSSVSGLHTRPLQRLFRDHVGASPKIVIRRYRLQEAAERITKGVAPRFTELAAELGYADQAHFTRDFRAVTGFTPSALAKRFAARRTPA
jgi:AraC-like DNA-binding protein